MGKKKRKFLEQSKQGMEMVTEGKRIGHKIEGEGKDIKKLIESMDTSMDDDDLYAIEVMDEAYGGDFQENYKMDVEPKFDEAIEKEQEVHEGSADEKGKVLDTKEKLKEIQSVSEIGRRNAEQAEGHMEKSIDEYKQLMEQADKIIEKTKEDAKKLEESISDIFG